MYLLHGGGQDHTAFATRGWFRALASRDMIVVTPSVGDSWYVNSVADPTAKYEDFVVKDLIEFVDRQYRTIASRDGRAVAGVSMGAWGAMMLGLKHHQLFGAVGAMSAPFGISRQDPNMDMKSRTQQRFGAPETPERLERDPGTLVSTIPVESVPLLYLACGNQDIFVADNRRFVERLTARKIPYEYREVSPFGHSWDVWDGQLVSFIDVMSTRWRQGLHDRRHSSKHSRREDGSSATRRFVHGCRRGGRKCHRPATQQAPTGYDDTPMQPDGKWRVHDITRPRPPVVSAGPLTSLAPPSDAVVLLGPGNDL